MMTISPITTILYTTLIISSCNNLTKTDSKIKNIKDSLTESRQIIDSLTKTDSTLFDKALKLEKDSSDKAITIYRQIADRHIDNTTPSYKTGTDYSTQALNRIHYLESLKFLKFLKSDNVENIEVMTYHRINVSFLSQHYSTKKILKATLIANIVSYAAGTVVLYSISFH